MHSQQVAFVREFLTKIVVLHQKSIMLPQVTGPLETTALSVF